MLYKIALLLAVPVVLYSDTTHIDLYPLLLSSIQLCAAEADLITTEMCISEGAKKNLPVYENNPMIVKFFGRKPKIAEFLLMDFCGATATYLIAKCIKKSPLRKIWWIPQISVVYSSIDQSIWNYRLYDKLHREP